MPLPSVMRTSTIEPRRLRIGRDGSTATSATIVTFSSMGSSSSAVSSPRRA